MADELLPSRYILQKAWKLGQTMAYGERRLRPNVENCHQYPSYNLFRTVHRHSLEGSNVFHKWDAKLQLLIEREAHASGGLQDPRQQDVFYRNVAGAIRSSFWYGWEQVHELEVKYEAEVERYRKSKAPTPALHLYAPPERPEFKPTALPEGEELQDWEHMAKAVFDEMSGDSNETLWELPSPDEPLMKRSP